MSEPICKSCGLPVQTQCNCQSWADNNPITASPAVATVQPIAPFLKSQMELAAIVSKLFSENRELQEALKHSMSNCACSVRERNSGHRLDCYTPQAEALLSRLEKEGE